MKSLYSETDFKPMSLMSLLLSFISLVIVFYLLFTPLSAETRHTLVAIDTIICCLFLFQLSIDCYRSNNRLHYLKSHWIDIAASIPAIEVLRFARLLHIIRIILIFRNGEYFLKQIKKNRKEATLATIFTLLIILVSTGSSMMLMLERHAIDSNITNAADALWWSLVTISTVGYGDHYPVTFDGKILASGMIICGVGIFGMVSGLITSIVTSPHKHDHNNHDTKHLAELIEQQKKMMDKIDQLEQLLQQNADHKKGTQ